MGGVKDGSLRAVPSAGPRGALWSGKITVPCGCGPVRLVVQEYEPFLADGPHYMLTNDDGAAQAERLIYADVLEL